MDGEQLMMVPHELRQKILVENHDVPTAGHVGINRTVDLIKRNYWWRGIWGDVAAYVRSCLVCQWMKSDNRKKAGELQPIPLLREHGSRSPPTWSQIYRVGWQDRYCCFRRPSHQDEPHGTVYQRSNCVPVCPAIRGQRIPAAWNAQVIISDRDPRFVSKFWDELFSLLGTDLRFSIAFHPQTDGQSEVTIRVLGEFSTAVR